MIADDYAAIAKAQKALEAKPEPKVDVMEPLFVIGQPLTGHMPALDPRQIWWGFVPHDPVVPPCDSGE